MFVECSFTCAYLENNPIETGRQVGRYKRATLVLFTQEWRELFGQPRRCFANDLPKLGERQLPNFSNSISVNWREV